MKTEKEFSDIFVNHFFEKWNSASTSEKPLNEQFLKQITQLSYTYWADMTSHLSHYFTNQDRMLITQIAASNLSSALSSLENQNNDNFSENIFLACWSKILLDFNKNYWGFQQINEKPKIKETEEQKIFWKLFKYGWAFFQSMIILKIAVYYFGLESAEHPDQTSSVWVWVFFSISVGSLAFFAYRNRHDQG